MAVLKVRKKVLPSAEKKAAKMVAVKVEVMVVG